MNAVRPLLAVAVLAVCGCPSGKPPPAGDGIIADRPVSPRDGRVVEAATDSSALDRALADRLGTDAPKPDAAHPDARKPDAGPHPDGLKPDAAPPFGVTWYPNAAGTPGSASCPSGTTAVAGGGACAPEQLSSSIRAASGTGWQTMCRSGAAPTATYVGCGGAGVTVSAAPGGTCPGSLQPRGGECECQLGAYGIRSYGYSPAASPPAWTCSCGQTATAWSTICAQVSGTLTLRTDPQVAHCGPGEFAVSGGCFVDLTVSQVRVSSSVPDPLPTPAGAPATGWRCSFYDPSNECAPGHCTAVVLCYQP